MKRSIMKKIFISIYIVIVAALLILIGNIFSNLKQEPEDRKEQVSEEVEEPEQEDEADISSAESVLRSLVDVLYTYDTRERMFYEGAEAFMTEKAYEQLVPLQDVDGEELPVRQMVSRLREMTCYFRTDAGGRVEAMAEVWYQMSGTGDYGIRQILKFTLVDEDGWKVSECTVLDTMEQ